MRHTRSRLPVLLAALLLVPVLLPGMAGRAAGPGPWTATGSMITARKEYTATRLLNGQILVAGGEDSAGNNLASAELYDPRTGTWTATGHMMAARSDHTATLLPDGRVLVAGGNLYDPLASAELYDPRSGHWTATGHMTTRRVFQTATLLPSGQVLVVGGQGGSGNGSEPMASAELYTPHTGLWTATGTMTEARSGHTATLLPDGRVLAVGGADDQSAELYDPHTGRWTATGGPHTGTEGATVTLLGTGQVLLAGGDVEQSTSAELYNPRTGGWTDTGRPIVARDYGAAVLLLTGQVLVAGGLEDQATAELYDPRTGLWTRTDGPPPASAAALADGPILTLLAGGQVLATGGDGRAAALYTPRATALASVQPLRLAFGLHPVGSTTTSTITLTNVGLAPLRVAHIAISGARPADFTATACPGESIAVSRACAVRINFTPHGVGKRDAVLLIADTATTSPQRVPLVGSGYDTGPNAWSPTGSLVVADPGVPTTGVRAVPLALPSGKVLVVGANAQEYDPRTGRWTEVGREVNGQGGTATLLATGQVLITGGAVEDYPDQHVPCTGQTSGTTSRLSPAAPRGDHVVDTVVAPAGRAPRPLTSRRSAPDPLGPARPFPPSIDYPLCVAVLYDPRTGARVTTGRMATGRFDHTATLLADGRVLVAGGVVACAFNAGCTATARAEVYDPRTGRWTTTGAMHRARAGQVALLLAGGQVLVIDASNGSCERYDPRTGRWTVTGSLRTARRGYTATLLRSGQVLVAGGTRAGVALASVELYDPRSGRWTATSSMHSARAGHSATLLPDGRVLVAGGMSRGRRLAGAEIYDPRRATWTVTGRLIAPRSGHLAVVLPTGQVLVAEGATEDDTSAELYAPGPGS